MKKLPLIILAFLLNFNTFLIAQQDTIWFDTNWKKTSKNNAAFYRNDMQKKNNGYWFTDYYISGSKQMEGLSLNKDQEVFQGTVKWYHENGNIFQIVNYNHGHLDGKRQVFFKNGQLKSEGYYKDGKKDGKWKELFENGKTKEAGNFENNQKEGLWRTYYQSGDLKDEGKYVFDRKVDIWKTNYYDGTLENN